VEPTMRCSSCCGVSSGTLAGSASTMKSRPGRGSRTVSRPAHTDQNSQRHTVIVVIYRFDAAARVHLDGMRG
jgi:hypothetical protein